MTKGPAPKTAVVTAELGALVHGPVVLARSPGIVAGLRCVFAHPSGLHLPARDPWSGPVLTVEIDGHRRIADPAGGTSSGSADVFHARDSYGIGALPTDGRLGLSIGRPRAGLAGATTVLELDDLEDPADRVQLLRG